MQPTTQARWTALAGFVAVVSPAVIGLSWWLRLVVAISGSPVLFAGVTATVGSVAAAVALALALRRRDASTSVVTTAVLVGFAAQYLLRGGAVPAAVGVLGTLLLVAFGLLMLRRTGGAIRVLPWIVVVCGALWAVMDITFTWVPLPGLPDAPQTVLVWLTSVPSAAADLAWLAAAGLFVPPLLRPLGAGFRQVWAAAEVR